MTSLSKWAAASVAWVVASAALPSSADLASCLRDTGYALSEINSAAYVENGLDRATPGITCDPPWSIDLGLVGGEGSYGATSYVIEFGASFSTSALASPTTNYASSARAVIEQYFQFTVIPDAAGATDPVSISIVARHRFGTVQLSVDGRGQASIRQTGRYSLRRDHVSGTSLGSWNSEGAPISAGGVFDIVRDVDAPPSRPLIFIAYLSQECWTHSGGSSRGSAGCSVQSNVSFEISTDAAASIVFDLEEGLGMPPPQLDVVPVPEPGAPISSGVALAVLLALAARSRLTKEPC